MNSTLVTPEELLDRMMVSISPLCPLEFFIRDRDQEEPPRKNGKRKRLSVVLRRPLGEKIALTKEQGLMYWVWKFSGKIPAMSMEDLLFLHSNDAIDALSYAGITESATGSLHQRLYKFVSVFYELNDEKTFHPGAFKLKAVWNDLHGVFVATAKLPGDLLFTGDGARKALEDVEDEFNRRYRGRNSGMLPLGIFDKAKSRLPFMPL